MPLVVHCATACCCVLGHGTPTRWPVRSCGRYTSERFVFQNTTQPSTFVFSYADDFFLLSALPHTHTYLATITGPAFHSIAPDSLCFVKPKLTTLTHYFNFWLNSIQPLQQVSTVWLPTNTPALKLPRWLNISLSSLSSTCLWYLVWPCGCFAPVLTTSLQVCDYGVCLHYNNYDLWFHHCWWLFLVFLGLAPKGQYARSCLLYLHLLNHWKEHNLSIYRHLQASIYSFNEEVGEMTFAQLARTVLGNIDQSSMTKLREAYQAQPYVGQSHLSAKLILSQVCMTSPRNCSSSRSTCL